MKNKNEWNLRDYEKTLKETSYDNDQCMTNSQIKVICFDDFVKEEYCPNRKLIGALSSNDALYCCEGKYVFIEFKNGKLIKRNNDEIRKLEKKNINSMFILLDLTKNSFHELSEKTDYILVYNKEKNDISKIGDYFIKQGKSKKEIQDNDEIISFGLEKFKGYCFKNVHTYSKEEFETKFVKRIENGM